MQITYVKLYNFCQFSNLTIDLKKIVDANNASIIGLVGNNAAGKSNIFKAIRFAITGKSDRNLSEHINIHADEDDFASVELHFYFNGHEGKIYREIHRNGNNKRWLEWETKKITAAKAIDEKLQSIFGTNKQILDNAVFISQGEINTILSGTDKDREILFLKLFDLIFLEKNADILQIEIKKLESKLPKFLISTDELEGEISIKKNQLELNLKKLINEKELNSINSQIEIITCVKKLQDQIDKKEKQLIPNQNLIIHHTKLNIFNIKNTLKSKKKINYNIDEIYRYNAELGNALEKCEERIKIKKKEIQLRNAYAKYTPKLTNTEISNIRLEYKDLNNYKKFLEAKKIINKISQEKPNKDKELEQAYKKEKALSTQIVELDKELNQLETRQKQLQLLIRLSLHPCKNQKCNCGLPISDEGFQLLKEGKDSFQKEIEDNEQKFDSKTKLKVSLLKEHSLIIHEKIYQLKSDLEKFIIDQKNAQNIIEDLDTGCFCNASITSLNLEDISHKIKMNESIISDYDLNNQKYKEHKTRWDNFISDNNEKLDLNSKIEILKTEILNIKLKLQESQVTISKIEEIKRIEKELNDANNTLSLETFVLSKLEESIIEDKNEIDNYLKQLNIENTDLELENLNNKLKDKQNLNIEVETICKQIKQDIEEKEQALKIKKQELEHQNKTYKLIETLTIAKSLFSRSGIGLNYIKSQFGLLWKYTKENLELNDANFTIRINPENAVSFLFTDLKIGKLAKWQDMSALSGGQKVRLCIAFLLALQRLCLVNIGLLFLDEPSNHLDVEAVDSLITLFENMKSKLVASNSQLWICDHNTNLINLCNYCIKLSK